MIADALKHIVADGWGSHVPALIETFAKTSGPVLEIGCGHFSTPLLHSLCLVSRRHLLTVEADAEWAARFASLVTGGHGLIVTDDTDEIAEIISVRQWGLVLVDNAPDQSRRAVLAVVAKFAPSATVVCHDAERIAYRKQLAEFGTSVMHKVDGMPSTAVLKGAV